MLHNTTQDSDQNETKDSTVRSRTDKDAVVTRADGMGRRGSQNEDLLRWKERGAAACTTAIITSPHRALRQPVRTAGAPIVRAKATTAKGQALKLTVSKFRTVPIGTGDNSKYGRASVTKTALQALALHEKTRRQTQTQHGWFGNQTISVLMHASMGSGARDVSH